MVFLVFDVSSKHLFLTSLFGPAWLLILFCQWYILTNVPIIQKCSKVPAKFQYNAHSPMCSPFGAWCTDHIKSLLLCCWYTYCAWTPDMEELALSHCTLVSLLIWKYKLLITEWDQKVSSFMHNFVPDPAESNNLGQHPGQQQVAG